MQCGFFQRVQSGLQGRTGPLRMEWDPSGLLTVGCEGSTLGLQFSTGAMVVLADGSQRALAQSHDPQPQWIFVEEGPQRLALRLRYRLYDDDGEYHGDGLQNVFAYASGELFLGSAVSFADQGAHSSIADAWLSARPICAEALYCNGRPMDCGATPIAASHPLVLEGAGQQLAVAWHDESGQSYDQSGPAQPWVSGDLPPYYERWGDLYDQWPGDSGWSTATGGGNLWRGEEEIRWVWRSEHTDPAGILEGHRAILRLRFGADRERVSSWARACRQPLEPRATGADFRYWSTLDGTYAFRKEAGAPEAKLVFPPDPDARHVHICLFGLQEGGGVTAAVNGEAAVPQTVSLGGRLDDPLGGNWGRFDDGGGPLLTSPGHSPSELLLSARLNPAAPTEIVLREEPGLAMSYQRWDDRRQFTLTSSAAPGHSLGQFSLRDGRFRDITKPSAARFGIAQIPLYWFKANGMTPFHYLNQLSDFEMLENGPQQVVFRYVATNSGRRACSEELVRVWTEGDAVRFDIEAHLEVRERWDLPEIQYLNIFPCDSVDPEVWHHDQFVLADSSGRCMHYQATLPARQAARGDELWDPRGDLFFAEFSSDRGNLFILARDLQPADLVQRYQICSHWLDSHFHVQELPSPLAAGTRFSVNLEIALAGDAALTAEQARAIGERSLAEGHLCLGGSR